MFELWVDLINLKFISLSDIVFVSGSPLKWATEFFVMNNKSPKEDFFTAKVGCNIEFSGKIGDDTFIIRKDFDSIFVDGKISRIKVGGGIKDKNDLFLVWFEQLAGMGDVDADFISNFEVRGKYSVKKIDISSRDLTDLVLNNVIATPNPNWVLSEITRLLSDERFWGHANVYVNTVAGMYLPYDSQIIK